MKIAPVAEVKARFSAYMKETARGPVVVTKNGRPAVVIVRMEDPDELERFILAYSPKFMALLDAAEEGIRRTGGLSRDEVWRRVEARSRRRKRRAS